MKQTVREITITVIFSLCAIFAMTTAAAAATLTVTSTGDTTVGAAGCADGCSLREAITAAASGDTINFNSATFSTAQTINLTVNNQNGYLNINKNLIITGPGARLLTVRRNVTSAYIFGIFTVNSGFTVSISGLTAANGNASNYGGAFANFGTLTINSVAVMGDQSSESAINNQGTMTILNSTVSGSANLGIHNESGTLSIANSTISGNSGTGNAVAGGILNYVTLNLNNVTVANNANGGIENYSFSTGTINIRNTIITGSTIRGDAIGAFVSQGNNIVSNATNSTGFTQPTDKLNVVANLGAFADNGGNTNTHKPNANSPAIDAGNNCVVTATCGTNNPPVALTTDQRGTSFARQSSAAVDIGALEAPVTSAASVSITGRVVTAKGKGVTGVSVTVYGGSLSGPRTIRTSAFGYYRFTDLPAGETYILEVRAKRYSFTNSMRVVSLMDDAVGQDFVAEQ